MNHHFFVLFFTLITASFATRTEKKIYYEVAGTECFRRLNATHQIGCSSPEGGSVGVVHYIENEQDVDWIVSIGPNAPYIALVDSTQFTHTLIQKFLASGRVNGIMVIHTKNRTLTPIPPAGFSSDESCPNDIHGMYSNSTEYRGCKELKWNSIGDGLSFYDFGNFPIYALTNITNIEFMIKDCYKKYNKPLNGNTAREYPLCAAQLKSRMDAVKDAVTCMRRTNHQTNMVPVSYCQMLGDKNIYGTMKTVLSNETRSDDSVIIASSRMDSFSLFDGIYPSANNPVTGIVAVLSAAKAVAKFKDVIRKTINSKDIMFEFFQGEAYDYIGSSKLVYDMERNQFPYAGNPSDSVNLHKINLNHISQFIEMSQVGNQDDGSHWIHTDPISRRSTDTSHQIDSIVQLFKDIGNETSFSIMESDKTLPLPPASLQRFLMKRIIPGVVMTDHRKEFTNKYYNSRFDLPEVISASYPSNLNTSEQYNYITHQAYNLANLSTVYARVLYKLSTGMDNQNIQVDPLDVTHLLYCFLISPNCELFHEVLKDEASSKKLKKTNVPYPFYVTVFSSKTVNPISKFTRRLLAYFIGDEVSNATENNCSSPNSTEKMYQYYWMQGVKNTNSDSRTGVCMRASVDFSDSYSPAFIDKDNIDWSGQYSTWTESVWQNDALELRLFLIPEEQFKTFILSVGVVILLVSMVLVYFIDINADVLFIPSREPEYL